MLGKDRTKRSEVLIAKLWKIRNKTNMRRMEAMFKDRGCVYHYETIRDWFDDDKELSPCAIVKLEPIIDELIKDLKINGEVRWWNLKSFENY